MDDSSLRGLARKAGLIDSTGACALVGGTNLLPYLGRFLVLAAESVKEIRRDVLEAKIQEYLDTLDDTSSHEIYNTDHKIGKDELARFTAWLFKADEEKEWRRQQYLTLKAEFEPECQEAAKPKPAIDWQLTDTDAYVAFYNGREMANVWRGGESWIAQRWAHGLGAASKTFDSLTEAKAWAVGHL